MYYIEHLCTVAQFALVMHDSSGSRVLLLFQRRHPSLRINMPCECDMNVARCETCHKGFEDLLEEFVSEVEWDGKSATWNDEVMKVLRDNDIQAVLLRGHFAELFCLCDSP